MLVAESESLHFMAPTTALYPRASMYRARPTNIREMCTQVSNKVVELLMLRDGVDVCCTSEEDKTLLDRYSKHLAAQQL
jgi:hypothetical protein